MSARWLLGFGVPLLVLLVACIWITRTIGWRPFLGPKRRPLTARTFQGTPERLERGAYLAESVTLCIMCHSPVDWTKPDAPYDPGRKSAGGGFSMAGIRDKTLAPNITPDLETGIGSWTDGPGTESTFFHSLIRPSELTFPVPANQNNAEGAPGSAVWWGGLFFSLLHIVSHDPSFPILLPLTSESCDLAQFDSI